MGSGNNLKFDVGLIWAKFMSIWSQVGVIQGIFNTVMLVAVFYTTTISPVFQISFWLYITVIVVLSVPVLAFIIKVGISGYYRFINQQTKIEEIDRITKLIAEKMGVQYDRKLDG